MAIDKEAQVLVGVPYQDLKHHPIIGFSGDYKGSSIITRLFHPDHEEAAVEWLTTTTAGLYSPTTLVNKGLDRIPAAYYEDYGQCWILAWITGEDLSAGYPEDDPGHQGGLPLDIPPDDLPF